MDALILVDIQNDFLPGGALPVPSGDEIIPIANTLQSRFDLVVATQDWHPPSHGSFAANHPGQKVGDIVMLDGLRQLLWPVHCVQNTHGAAFPEELEVQLIRKVVQKGVDPLIDSYSGFYDNGRRHETGLASYLKSNSVDTVYLAGLATDYCVKATALDAASLGFKTHLLVHACKGIDLNSGDVEAATNEMHHAGVIISRSQLI